MSETKGNYPNTFYRVSVKAIIRDERGHVLCCKEGDSDSWSLPGGGIEHETTEHEGLQRELFEEIALTEPFTKQPLGIDTMFLPSKQAYLMWIVYELAFNETPPARTGEDASEAAYLDPKQFKDSPHRPERLIYKWTVDPTYDAKV